VEDLYLARVPIFSGGERRLTVFAPRRPRAAPEEAVSFSRNVLTILGVCGFPRECLPPLARDPYGEGSPLPRGTLDRHRAPEQLQHAFDDVQA
jgi:hypothetical protein